MDEEMKKVEHPIVKPMRLAVIEALPSEMQDYALVDWGTVAVLLGFRDVEHARETIVAAGVPIVYISERRSMPRWSELRAFILSREANLKHITLAERPEQLTEPSKPRRRPGRPSNAERQAELEELLSELAARTATTPKQVPN